MKRYTQYAIGLVGIAVFLLAPVGSSAAAEPPSEWTPMLRSQLLAEWKKEIDSIPFVVTADDRQRLAQCWVSRFTAAFPGGPAEVNVAGSSKVSSVKLEVGRACGREFIERISSSKQWTPAVLPTFVFSCVARMGEEQREYCNCVGKNGPKYFRTPAAFILAFNRAETDETPPAERAVERLTGSCSEHLSWNQAAVKTIVHSCSLEGGREWNAYCACVGRQAPTYYKSPAALSKAMGKSEGEMSSSEREIYRRFSGSCAAFLP